MNPTTLYYAHDPMCSWCWAFRPVWATLVGQLPDDVTVVRLLGGLAPDSDLLMPPKMRQQIEGIWHHIQKQVPGTQFNFDFWQSQQPRRSTYPACRAVIAARNQSDIYDEKMSLAIQQAYYLGARNPSDSAVLIEIAGELGLDKTQFEAELVSSETQESLLTEIASVQRMGIAGFPGLVVQKDGDLWQIPVNYTDAEVMLAAIGR